ncbi:MAG: PQQ-binding-like beta-propeller repeat protein [Candidatus Bathyarchaeia archaeon]
MVAYYAFGHNPWGTLAGGISVYWLNASKGMIGVAIPRVSLPTGGVLNYTSFAGASDSAPSGAAYARIRIEKMSYGFINFDNVAFATTDIWPMLQHDQQHTGYSLDTNIYPVPPLSKIWEYDTTYLVEPPPVVSNDGVYVVRYDGYVYKLDPFVGLPRWSSPTNIGASVSASLAVNEMTGHVYVGAGDSRLIALDTGTGGTAWTFTTSGPCLWADPIFSGGFVYTGSSSTNEVYKINETTGVCVWAFPTPNNGAPVSVALESGIGIVYVASSNFINDFRLYAIKDVTPAIVWQTPILSRWFNRLFNSSLWKRVLHHGGLWFTISLRL